MKPMRKKLLFLSVIAALVLATGCDGLGVLQPSAPNVPNAPSAPSAPNTPNTPNTPNNPSTPNVPDSPVVDPVIPDGGEDSEHTD